MKNNLSTKLALLAALIAAPSSLLALPVIHVPDSGSSAVLVAASAFGVFACRRFFANRK
jgi:hypothetical protein